MAPSSTSSSSKGYSSFSITTLIFTIIIILCGAVFLFSNSSSSTLKNSYTDKKYNNNNNNNNIPAPSLSSPSASRQEEQQTSASSPSPLSLHNSNSNNNKKNTIIRVDEEENTNTNNDEGLSTITPASAKPLSAFSKKKAQFQKQLMMNPESLKLFQSGCPLCVNYSDPFFDSEETCNRKIGGQLLPPEPCSRKKPCRDIMPSVHLTGLKELDFASFTSKPSYRCASFVCKMNDLSSDSLEDCTVLERGEYGGIYMLQGQVATKDDIMRIKKLATEMKRKLFPNETAILSKRRIFDRMIDRQKELVGKFKHVDDGPISRISIKNPWYPQAGTRHYCTYFPSSSATTASSSSRRSLKKNDNEEVQQQQQQRKVSSSNDNEDIVVPTTTSKNKNEHDTPSTNKNTNNNKKKIPLIIVIPSSGSDVDCMYKRTNIRALAESRNFAIATIQPLNRHWRAAGWIGPSESGQKNDDVFRNFTHNDDVKLLDTLIDTLAEKYEDIIDTKRIYLFGESNGLMFASFYGILRSGSRDAGALLNNAQSEEERKYLQSLYTGATPNGNKIAAVGGFSGGDPFKGVGWSKRCQTNPAPKSTIPIAIVSSLCDIVLCNWIREWVARLVTEIGSKEVRWSLLDVDGNVQPTNLCSEKNKKKYCSPIENMWGHMYFPHRSVVQTIEFLMKFRSD